MRENVRKIINVVFVVIHYFRSISERGRNFLDILWYIDFELKICI